jgi:NAD dependent epimerase/dehydratase
MLKEGSKVLVTGADGFIGSHLAEKLVEAGADVTALAYYNAYGSIGWLEDADPAKVAQMRIVAGDIRDPYFMARAMKGIEIVFHLAALIAIPHSYRAPLSYVHTNSEGTVNALEAACQHGVARFIHTSTSEVYGTARVVPITEEHPLSSQSPYAASKVAADQMALAFWRSASLPVAIVRPFNTYGPRQSARAVVPTILSQLVDGAESIRLGSLDPTRDFLFVEDNVAGYLAAARAPEEVVAGEVFNLGTGKEISIGDLARQCVALVNPNARVELDDQRLRPTRSDVMRLCADAGKAERLLGWKAKVGLAEGLERALGWMRPRMKYYRPKEYGI